MNITFDLAAWLYGPRCRARGAGVRLLMVLSSTLVSQGSVSFAQIPARPSQASRPSISAEESAILKALAENPVTSPFSFETSRAGSRVVLKGVVGSSTVHDVAIRTALVVTPSLDDQLVIDTSALPGIPTTGQPNLGIVANQTMNRFVGPGPLVYPRPLFGRFDDPFLGFEPPLITYPPWWVPAPLAEAGDNVLQAERDFARPRGDLPTDSVEMTIDPRGVAVLRGSVPNEADREAIARKAATLEGVVDVINLLEVNPNLAPRSPRSNVPPPPPMPDPQGMLNLETPPAPVNLPADPEDDPDLRSRVLANLKRQPLLEGLPIQVATRDGQATLSGEVPSLLEAMTAYRAAQQTIGVHEVVDRLRFAVPDGGRPNPLVAQGRPEDVEPYLLSQIRRQVGDQAHVDRVTVNGDRLQVFGTVVNASDRPRIEAILRSMAILRGFDLQPQLLPQ